MEEISVFHKLTTRLDKLLEQYGSSNDRKQQLDQVNDLIDKRGEIIHLLKQPIKDEEKTMMEEILSMEVTIQNRLEENFDSLKKEMRLNKKQQSSNQKYTNPYLNITGYDGMFLDQKK